MKEQFRNVRDLKQKLPKNEMIVQMDFAENFVCRSSDEVQSAYLGQVSVTLHPVVVYYRKDDDTLAHSSFVIVSDELQHTASTVCSFIDTLTPKFMVLPGLRKVHYWTDSRHHNTGISIYSEC